MTISEYVIYIYRGVVTRTTDSTTLTTAAGSSSSAIRNHCYRTSAVAVGACSMVARAVSPERARPEIPHFYADRALLITGATGFMGKVLVERLLSTCPDIGCLYLLVREKKHITPEKRLEQLKQSQVFDGIRERCPWQLDKLRIVPGDASQPQLGLTDDCIREMEQVSVVINSAATLKFQEPLEIAMNTNVHSVLALLALCDALPNVQALVHVSTAYTNAERDLVDEQVYDAPISLSDALAICESVPKPLLADITGRLISPKPNTYTFTKSLAEVALQQHKDRKYNIAIFRPSIVISAHRDPYPGWIENLNGPSGAMAGVGKGILHVMTCDGQARADLLPVDIAIDTLIAVAWETATNDSPEVRVYNCTSMENPTTWEEFKNGCHHHRTYPPDNAFWYPFGLCIPNRFLYNLLELTLQTAPLYIAEYISNWCGIKKNVSLRQASQRLRAMNDVLLFFMLREWQFSTDNVKRLRDKLSPLDAQIYNLDIRTVDWDEHYKDFAKGVRRYLLKDKDETLPEAKQHMVKLRVLHYVFMLVLVTLSYKSVSVFVQFLFNIFCKC